MGDRHYDLIVIGSGAAGSAAWIHARRMGKTVAVFEAEVLGGECPTFACVPTKALLHCAEVYETARTAEEFGVSTGEVSFDYARIKERKDLVVSRTGAAQGEKPLREAGVDVYRHHARFVGPDIVEADGVHYRAERFLIATGSEARIPDIPGLKEAGYLTFREAIDLTRLPASFFILGGGAVGCEFTQIFNSFGVQVTISDHNPHLLAREEPEAGGLLGELFSHRGVKVLTDTEVAAVQPGEIVMEGGQRIAAERILIATGKAPQLDLGLEQAGIEYTPRGVIVDDMLRTSNPRVYAAGDVAGPYLFTHAASYQGFLAVQNAFRDERRRADYRAVLRCVFTNPEFAAVGLTERQARERGYQVRTGTAYLEGLGRANTTEEFDGLVKVVANEEGRLLGGTIVAPRAGEMIHELGIAITLGATVVQIAGAIHAFPTFSEAIMEACGQV